MFRRLPREWTQHEFKDAKSILIGLRKIQVTYPLSTLDYKAASLRTRELRPYLEGRQAALFCHGMGELLGTAVSFALIEDEDFDFITRRLVGDEVIYTPVQLKEWVPNRIREVSSLQEELDKLSKYGDSRDLVVAFCLNRDAKVEFRDLRLPEGVIGELWFFGAKTPDQSTWWLMGNALRPDARAFEFEYPT